MATPPAVDEFRELSRAPVTGTWRYVVQTTTTTLWVACYACRPWTDKPGGLHVWSRRYDRPPGKTESECLRAALRAAVMAAEVEGWVIPS